MADSHRLFKTEEKQQSFALQELDNTASWKAVYPALSHAARGEFHELMKAIEEVFRDKSQLKQLLTERGNAVTRSGMCVLRRTLLECAFEEFDTRMVRMIMPFFDHIEDGEKELEIQLGNCRKALEKFQNEETYETSRNKLIQTIKESSVEDVGTALAQPTNYTKKSTDLAYRLLQYRIDTRPNMQVVLEPEMHDNPKEIIALMKSLTEEEWWKEENKITIEDPRNKNNHTFVKADFIWIQMICWLMRNLVGVHRFNMARNSFQEDTNNNPLARTTACVRSPNESFPEVKSRSYTLETGFGFEFGFLPGYGTLGAGSGNYPTPADYGKPFGELLEKTVLELQKICEEKPALKNRA